MNRTIFLVAFACASPAAFAADPTKLDETIANPEPRYPEAPFEPPSQSIPQSLPGRPSPLRVTPNEGTGRPAAPRSDADLIRGLKAAILDDPSAPTVKGLKIAVVDGRATLRGAVRSQKEKDIVTAKAGAVAGLRNVTNDITVAP